MNRMIKYWMGCCLVLVGIYSNAQTDYVFEDAVKPVRFDTPVNISDSLPKVNVWINGYDRTFVIDNGAAYLVINASQWQSPMSADSAITARGAGGAVNAGTMQIDSFYWQGITKSNFKAIAAALPHLGDNVSGLLGYDIFKNYEVTFNYADSIISFLQSDSIVNIDTVVSAIKIPFTMIKHLPVLKVMIGKDSLLMAIDCGSAQNLVRAAYLGSIKDVSDIKQSVLYSAGTAPAMIIEGVVPRIVAGTVGFENMKFRFDDAAMNHINQSLPQKIDGMLGYPFLRQYKMSLNYNTRLLTIYLE